MTREEYINSKPKEFLDALQAKLRRKRWRRTCQACGHEQTDVEPRNYSNLSEAYANRTCKKCKSQCFDLGSDQPAYVLTPEEQEFMDTLETYDIEE